MWLHQADLDSPMLPAAARIAVVATSGPVDPDRLGRGLDVLLDWGYEPMLGHNVHAVTGHTAGTPAQREADLRWAFLDSGADAVWAARGGFGAAHLLDGFAEIAGQLPVGGPPVPLIGFSDVTALHSAITRLTGAGAPRRLVGVHAPVVTALGDFADAGSRARLRDLLARGRGFAAQVTGPQGVGLEAIDRDGQAPGTGGPDGIGPAPLLGGNLSVLASIVGSRYSISPRGAILVLEDINEANRSLDRLLTQLHLAGTLRGVLAVVLGAFSSDEGPKPHWEQFVADRLAGLGIPVFRGLPVGHVPRNWPWIVGAPALITQGPPEGALPRQAIP